ncbi:THAP domain-containing protein 1-like [Maniola jurtina]|uniref:THAP domain-containing protein 1-like n=1 Tax=Maniola jurtina TaxID=191418 RepID=UPI001E687D3E|nr:THAP domain-containing protein 1-like [Maniola jurtina]
MVRCAVPSCSNDSRRQNKINNDISYHRFPKSREMANKWVKAIKRRNWEPNIRSAVCSIHFSPSSISETKRGLRKLVEGAIPELHLEVQDCVTMSEKMTLSTDQVNVVPSTSQTTGDEASANYVKLNFN